MLAIVKYNDVKCTIKLIKNTKDQVIIVDDINCFLSADELRSKLIKMLKENLKEDKISLDDLSDILCCENYLKIDMSPSNIHTVKFRKINYNSIYLQMFHESIKSVLYECD